MQNKIIWPAPPRVPYQTEEEQDAYYKAWEDVRRKFEICNPGIEEDIEEEHG